jgi:hypothetical protein
MPQLVAALQRLLDGARRFPTVNDVKAELGIGEPTMRDYALSVADKIFQAISRYGALPPGNVHTGEAIRRALGPAIWKIVERQGGWNAVVERAGEHQASYRAQLRDLAESYARTGIINPAEVPERLPTLAAALADVPRDPQLPSAGRVQTEARLEELKEQRRRLLGGCSHGKEGP